LSFWPDQRSIYRPMFVGPVHSCCFRSTDVPVPTPPCLPSDAALTVPTSDRGRIYASSCMKGWSDPRRCPHSWKESNRDSHSSPIIDHLIGQIRQNCCRPFFFVRRHWARTGRHPVRVFLLVMCPSCSASVVDFADTAEQLIAAITRRRQQQQQRPPFVIGEGQSKGPAASNKKQPNIRLCQFCTSGWANHGIR
jgi:hypothetical protein